MLIGILSDTHDRLPALEQALTLFAARRVGAVIHAGDLVAPFTAKRLADAPAPLSVIYGNNDGERAGLKAVLPQIQDGPLFLGLDGRSLLVHHFLGGCDPADVARADVVVTGHTHEARVDRHSAKLFVNPGECCGWVSGRCTVALLDTQGWTVEICELSTS